jgi:N-acetylglucosamine repressor
MMQPTMKKATQQQTKEHNRSLVLSLIFKYRSISRSEIARITHLTRTTVSDIVSTLLDEGLVSEIGIGESQGGKSPILLSLVDNSRYLVGLDLAQSEFRGAIINLRGHICAMVTMQLKNPSGEEALEHVYEIVDQLIQQPYLPLVGIGVGTPGLVKSSEGIVVRAVNLSWENLPLRRLLTERYQLPVHILNDSQAAALGEFTYGRGYVPESSLVLVNARHGIGSGIVLNGKLYQGDGGGAGEFGHTVVRHENGPLCRCGNYGCLESVASAQVLVQLAQQVIEPTQDAPEEITLEDICHAFHAGDPKINELVMENARLLGMGIASLVGVLDIHKIVLSGDMTCLGQPWLDGVQQALVKNALPRLARETKIEIGQLGKNNILLGASAALVNDYSLLFNKQPEKAD